MVVSIGLDLAELDRVGAALARFGDRFLARVFTPGEIAYCTARPDPVPHLAGRFAAKEAAMKALGTGHARGVTWREVEVARAPGRPPELRLHGRAQERARALGARGALLSITHSRQTAAAVVILTGE